MAVRERKGRASPWQCYWNNPITGKRECANFPTRVEAEKHDSLIKHRLKFDRESFKKEEEEEDQGTATELTLEQAYILYLREKQFNKNGLAWQLGCMKAALSMFARKPVREIGKKEAEMLLDALRCRSIKALTVREYMHVLHAVLSWAAEKGFCPKPDFPRMPKAEPKRFVPPSVDELGRMLAVAPPHLQRILILGSQTGLRVGGSELFSLKWENVDLLQGILRVHGARKNLRAFWREIPLKPSLVETLGTWKAEDSAANCEWLIHYKGRPVQNIRSAWKATLERAGITRHIRPYDLRHAFATELIASGVDIGTVAKLMGHSSPVMILNHYQYVMDKQKREAIDALPDIPYVPNTMCPKRKGLR